jgi:hypothetical protein
MAMHGGVHAHDSVQATDNVFHLGDLFHFQTVDSSEMSFLNAPAIFAWSNVINIHEHGGPPPHFGQAETFQGDAAGSFPKGWSDVALGDPLSMAPKPSVEVVSTSDAFGHPTKALATLPFLGLSQGIYRSIEPSSFYSTSADVRVDQFSDFDPSVLVEDPNNPGFLLCGCPVGSEDLVDWPMQVGFTQLQQGKTNLVEAPNVGIVASSETQSWKLFALTANVLAVIDLGVPVQLGKWYGVEFDMHATGSAHARITDVATHSVLADKVASFADFGPWDPTTDGVFNVESFFDGEGSAKTTPNLAVIDNIDVPNPHASADFGHDLH